MASNNHHCAPLVLHLSIFLLFFSSSTPNLIKAYRLHDMAGELCANTNHLALCSAVVKHGPGTAMEATISMIEATILQTELAMMKIEKHIKESSSKGGIAKMNLKTCKEVYDDAISNLKTSIDNAKAKCLPDLKINLSAVISDFSACEDGYLESPGTAFPISHVNGVLSKLASASLALASEVKE